jgi:Rieske 2Fe-2S family protein
MAEPQSSLLRRVEPGLPTSFYVDPDDYRVVRIGDQAVLVLRDLEGRLQAFHNTCRHRGSALCTEARGRLPGAAIICPYHGWTYSLQGELRGARHQLSDPTFPRQDHSLYPVAVDAWAGFVFVNLEGGAAPPLAEALGEAPAELANWPLAELRVGHRVDREIACNWKVFWENFSECFHCPGVHPELSRLVPAYGRGLLAAEDDPQGVTPAGLAEGAVTWTLDGSSRLPAFEGLDAAERRRGQSFGVLPPSFFAVAHVDYVRFARMRPLGPERMQLCMEWLFHPEVLERGFDREHAVSLGERVMEQDARACEWNQEGLHCAPHRQGVLVPQEYGVLEFHDWIRKGLRS